MGVGSWRPVCGPAIWLFCPPFQVLFARRGGGVLAPPVWRKAIGMVTHLCVSHHCHSGLDGLGAARCQHLSAIGQSRQSVWCFGGRLDVWCWHDHDTRLRQPFAHFVCQRQFARLAVWFDFCRHRAVRFVRRVVTLAFGSDRMVDC